MTRSALSLASLMILLFIVSACGQNQKPLAEGVVMKDISANKFEEIYDPGKYVVLDVRTQKEWDEGHLKGAIHIDVKKSDFAENIEKLDKDKAYIVYCKMGGRSSRAQKIMSEKGFVETYNVVGGMTMMKMTDLEIVEE